MAAQADNLVALTRGMAVDKDEDGSSVFFTEAEVIIAINQAKHDLFGRRPDAFSSGAIVTEEPPDILSVRTALEFTYGETTGVLQFLADSLGDPALDEGTIGLLFKSALSDGTLLYFGDSDTNYIHVSIADKKLAIDIFDSSAGESASLETAESLANGSWSEISIVADGSTIKVTDGSGNETSADYAGDLIPGSDQAYLGYSNIAGTEEYFGGGAAELVISDNTDTVLASYDMDDGSGPECVDSVSGNNMDIHHDGGVIPWTSEDEIEMAGWAEVPLCYLASSLLMTQKSKDSYYRKAADQNLQKYLGSI